MARTRRRAVPALIQRLLRQPFRFDFFQAVRLMVQAKIRLNRENVADFIRENRTDLGQPEGIATKRAALVAKWGRDNTDEIKAVS